MVVEKAGKLAVLKPLRSPKRKARAKTKADYEAFRSAAGGWADGDTDKLIKDIYADRNLKLYQPSQAP